MATLESTGLSGYGFADAASSAAVQRLQQAMKSLSQAANWPAADPGPIDGIVGSQTTTALLVIINTVKEVPSSVKTALSTALIAAQANANARAEAYSLVASYATALTTAILAAIARYAGSTQPSAPTSGGPKTPIAQVPIPIKAGTVKTSAAAAAGGTFWSPPPGTPWYKQGRVYAIGGGIAALGAGAFFLFRR